MKGRSFRRYPEFAGAGPPAHRSIRCTPKRCGGHGDHRPSTAIRAAMGLAA